MTCNPKIAYTGVVAAALLLLQGCWVVSLNPLNESEQQAAVDDRLVGVWCEPEEEEPFTLVVKRGDGKRYTFSYQDDNKPVTLDVQLAEIGGRLFLDLRGSSLPDQQTTLVLPVSSFLRAELSADKLELTGISPSGTLSVLERRKDLPYVRMERHYDAVLLTASTDELRSWLGMNGDNPEIFTDDTAVLERRKPANPGEEASCAFQQ